MATTFPPTASIVTTLAVGQGPAGPAYPSAAAQAATEAARDAAAASAVAAAASDASAAAQVALATTQAGIATGAAGTATNQANLAQTYAASAASVAQQDLSAIARQIHFSPNAIAALFTYDTSKDSDGGAWIDKVSHTSWMNEALNGVWRGACATEAACRAISGAATGDFFQLITDGKFYKLNAGAGTTEVFRGNTAKFPRLAQIVAEAPSVTIYDLTQPGCPMWMRFASGGSGGGDAYMSGTTGDTKTAAAAINGEMCIGQTTAGGFGLARVNFLNDSALAYSVSSTYGGRFNGNISQRNLAKGYPWPGATFVVLASSSANAVAMTVLPDAPVDPVTGLQVPTIAVGTAGGISVIKHDGTVVNSANTASFGCVAITPQLLSASTTTTSMYFAATPGALSASFAVTTLTGGSAPGFTLATGPISTLMPRRGIVAARQGTRLGFMRLNESSQSASPAASVTDTYATGYMIGDIRRAWLSDTVAGSVAGTELIQNSDNESALMTGVTGVTVTGQAGTVATSAEQAQSGTQSAKYTCNTATNASHYLFLGIVPAGLSVEIIGWAYLPAGSLARLAVVDTNDGSVNSTIVNSGTVAWTYFRLVRNAKATPWSLGIGNNNFEVADTKAFYVDNISVKLAEQDRSYKAKPLSIYGTLTKTPVALGAQLVFYGPFSAANYLREPYSADLDFGTGAWTVTVPLTGITAAASTFFERSAASGPSITFGTDATGKLTGSAFDGTTTRTVTSAAVYTGTQVQSASLEYAASGSLTLKVNGAQVAQTTGAALLTLNNAAAVATVGNNFALTAAFPGSIALVKVGATNPTTEQAAWIYEQEKQMFNAGAQITLPDAGAIVDLAYDEALDRWCAVSAANLSCFTGLVRTSVMPVPSGSYSKVASASGVQAAARTTTSPGVDITIPAYGLRSELVSRSLAAARLARQQQVFDFDAIAAQVDFVLPSGWTAVEVISAGASKREGAAKDWIRVFDGFRETVRFAVAPGAGVWVQIAARRVP